MSTAMPRAKGSNGRRDRWGERAQGWAAQEELEAARYDEAIERVGLAPGDAVLDVGCGSGVFLRRAADRGARVAGIDASGALVEIARRRVPEADVRVGELEALPFEDGSFDLVTGFNSFFFAGDMVEALREAARVARPGGRVLVQVWGRPERCDLVPMLQALRALRGPADEPPPVPLSEPGVLEDLAARAGLTPEAAFDARLPIVYDDEHELLRRVLSPGPTVETIEQVGERVVARTVVEALERHRAPDGSYRLENEWHYLVARA